MVGLKDFNIDDEVTKAKQYLKTSSGSSANLYEHFCKLLNRVLTERPHNAADLIESYMEQASTDTKHEEKSEVDKQVSMADLQLKLFDKSNDDDFADGVENEEEFEIPLPNCAQLAFFFEQAGIGLGREETYKIFLALKQLVFNYPLASVRFWGKIFGTESNYIVAEVEFREGEGEDEEATEKRHHRVNKYSLRPYILTKKRCHKCGLRKPSYFVSRLYTVGEEEDLQDQAAEEEGDGPTEEDDLPKSTWKPPPVIPKEDHHTGANKKVYFVCNEPGEAWVKLPHVTPAEISLSRQITKLFTGRLDAQINSYPPFVGAEANLLRAQIARISASTQISPAGCFIFDEDDEEDDEEAHESYMVNMDFEGLSLRELTDLSMCNWVHHAQNILPQGRCSWFNPYEKPEDDFDEDEFDDDEEENGNNITSEIGPQLLSSVANDTGIDSIPSWSTSVSSRVLPEYAVGVARSNRWPGAYAFAKGKIYENIYIGWGQKYSSQYYTPPSPPMALEEFPDDPEVTEMEDPSVEEERALKEREDEAMKAADDIDNLDDEDEDDE